MKRSVDIFHFRKKYHSQRSSAARRCIDFNMTFTEWLQLWSESGQLFNRGSKRGQYVMARFGDTGPYEIGNVEIILGSQNCSDIWKTKGPDIKRKQSERKRGQAAPNKGVPHSPKTKAKMSAAHLGKKCPHNVERFRILGLARKGKKLSAEHKAAFCKGRVKSIETKAKMSQARKLFWKRKRETNEIQSCHHD